MVAQIFLVAALVLGYRDLTSWPYMSIHFLISSQWLRKSYESQHVFWGVVTYMSVHDLICPQGAPNGYASLTCRSTCSGVS